MISSTIRFSVAGENYEDIVEKTKKYIAEFFDLPIENVEKKVNIEISIRDQKDSLDFDEDEYFAEVIAQVKNV